jgi:hypothetical protein
MAADDHPSKVFVPTCLFSAAAIFLVATMVIGTLIFVVGRHAAKIQEEEEARLVRELPGYGGFRHIENTLGASKARPGSGTDATATRLAEQFSHKYQVAVQAALPFRAPRTDTPLPGGPAYATWCQVRGDQYVFITNAPRAIQPTPEQQQKLVDLAWIAASEVAREAGAAEGTHLAVGIRGDFQYGAVLTGVLAPPDKTIDGITNRGLGPDSAKRLLTYLAPARE